MTRVEIEQTGSVCSMITVRRLDASSRWVPMDVGLVWSPDDPLAVNVQFPKGNTWQVARDLLSQGVKALCTVGEGDVVFSPYCAPGFVLMTLRNFSGRAVLEVPKRELRDFLAATRKCRASVTPRAALDAWLSGVLAS